MELKQVTSPFKAKTLDDLGAGAGYLAVFRNVDGQKDAIQPGAFARSLAFLEESRKRRNGRYLLPVLWQHNPYEPVGGFTKMREDDHGLYVEFEIDIVMELGRRAYNALKKGFVGGFSIGYRTIKDRMRSDGVRELLEVELIEGSVVTFPANVQAVPLAGSMKGNMTLEEETSGLVLAMKGALDTLRKRYGMKPQDDERFYSVPPLMSIVRSDGPLPTPLDETRAGFERDLRASRRADDSVLGLLEPGSKAYNREVEARRKQREDRQRAQSEALAAERKRQAECQQAMSAETFSPETFAQATGYDLAWVRNWFAQAVNSGRVAAVDPDKLVLRAQDVRNMAKRDFEQLEYQAVKAAHKRAAERAA